jgi:methane/ammonia monooxygenase subunit B
MLSRKLPLTMSQFLLINMVFVILALTLSPPVYAHGERSQEPFLRMRTIQWYDVKWSTENLAVNDTMVVKGKFRVASNWPDTAAKPDVAFLNISLPGPVFVRTKALINGVNMINSTSLELGRDYEWEVHLKARHPGRWHVHAMLNVQDAGPIVGPGQYVEVTGDHDDFVNEITTITGETINLDNYGLKTNIFWHSLWGVLAVIWLAYWLHKPLLFYRFRKVNEGHSEILITRTNKIVAAIMLGLSLMITFIGYQWAENRWPETIALQSASSPVEPLPQSEDKVKVKLVKGIYRLPGRSMEMRLEITNNTADPIRLGEFSTATVRFINPTVGLMDSDSANYPEHLLAKHGLTVSDDSYIAAGETRVMKVIAQDAAWETERLATLIYDPDSRFGGLLFFYDEQGNRYISSVGGVLSPRFI